MKNKLAQIILKNAKLYEGAIDGDFGKLSMESAHAFYDFPDDWNADRLIAGVIQVECVRKGISVGAIDGLWGNKTQDGYEKLLTLNDLKEKNTPVVSQTVNVKKTYNNWPKQNYNDMVKFFGPIGENQTTLKLPYNMFLAWEMETCVTEITCHEKVKDSLERILKNTLDHYGMDAIKELHLDRFGGCLNVRKMRGGSSWSIHSWGCAVDLDPDRNQLKWGRDKAYFARPEYEPFWKIVEAEGWTSLGRAKNFDWMHAQAANL